MFKKKQKFITKWLVVRTIKEVKPMEIRGFTPECVIGIFKTYETAYKVMQEFGKDYGYMQAYPIQIEI